MSSCPGLQTCLVTQPVMGGPCVEVGAFPPSMSSGVSIGTQAHADSGQCFTLHPGLAWQGATELLMRCCFAAFSQRRHLPAQDHTPLCPAADCCPAHPPLWRAVAEHHSPACWAPAAWPDRAPAAPGGLGRPPGCRGAAEQPAGPHGCCGTSGKLPLLAVMPLGASQFCLRLLATFRTEGFQLLC